MPQVDVVNLTVWNQIRSYLPPGTRVTSVYRPAQAQLNFIVQKAHQHGFKFTKVPIVEDPSSWQAALEFVRKKGYQVAPPGKSAHQAGIAYDLVGPDLSKIASGIRRAVADGRIKLAESKSALLIEKVNKCVHVEIVESLIHNDAFNLFDTA